MAKQTIKTECEACDGTGLYTGMCEPKGVAVICLRCDGTGCEEVAYTPFKGRKLRRDIKSVQRSRGSFIATGVGPSRVGDCLAFPSLTPARRVFFAGAVGGLAEGHAIGDFFVPTEVADGEGYKRN